MNVDAHSRTSKLPLLAPIAVVLLGILFFVFIVIEYQRNTSLIKQNKQLISHSAASKLINQIQGQPAQANWSRLKEDYSWIQTAPNTYWFSNNIQEFPWARSVQSSEPESHDIADNNQWHKVWKNVDSLSSSSVSNASEVDAERLQLLTDLNLALDSNKDDKIRYAFEVYIEHQKAYQLSPIQEIAFSFKLVEIGAKQHWSPELIHAILLTGGSSDAPIIRPVADLLFRHVDQFSDEEFKQITISLKKQLEAFNLSEYHLDDYIAHLESPRFKLSENSTGTNKNPELLSQNDWYLNHFDDNRVSAQAISISNELSLITENFIELGTLAPQDSLIFDNHLDDISLNDISVRLDKPELRSQSRNQLIYLIIKSGLLTLFVALILLTLRLIRKNQQRQFEYLSLKEDFVKLVSHELKTPLAGIRAMGETLRKRVERDLSVESYPERIISEADKLWYMVDNILGFNRIQSSEVRINTRDTRIKILCDQIIDDVQLISDKTYSVDNMIEHSTEWPIDIELFTLVIKNLLINAGLYNGNETIEIKLELDSDEQYLLVSDNGTGISKGDQERIFEPFVRLEQSVRRSGTGLGLAICKRIMQLHGGELLLDQSNNEGSVWKICLPH